MLATMSARAQRHRRADAHVAVVWRGDAVAEQEGIGSNERLRPIFDAFDAFGATAEPVVYRDEIAESVLARLARVDGVLVWVDPIGKNGETRTRLDRLLRTVSDQGVWVSAHPDVIDAVGTKEVLYRTRDVGWGHDVHQYGTIVELRDQLPDRLTAGPRVLKPHRGNGGIGIWKIELVNGAGQPVTLDTVVSVHEARIRTLDTDTMPLGEFLDRFSGDFADKGCIIDQPFQPRVAEGIIRSYLVANEAVGFAIQGPGDLINEPNGPERIMGLPAPKTMFPPDHPRFRTLREQLESQWLPAMQQRTGITTIKLPALWDIDFLLGPKAATGDDTYVLCEINASCITPFPPATPAKLAEATLVALAAHG
jgi:hypothetical protein